MSFWRRLRLFRCVQWQPSQMAYLQLPSANLQIGHIHMWSSVPSSISFALLVITSDQISFRFFVPFSFCNLWQVLALTKLGFDCFLFVVFFCYFQEFGGRSLEIVDIIELKSHHQNVPLQLCSARYPFLSTCCWIAPLRINLPPILLIYYCGTQAFRNRVLHQTIEISGLSGYSHAPASRFSSGSQLFSDDE